MALDQALLESAATEDFLPALRFLLWSPPGLSIGRFQNIQEIDVAECNRQSMGIVRRPTGGKCILHFEDFTYSLVLPSRFALPGGVVDAYTVICGGIINALGRLGLRAAIQSREKDRYDRVGGACFAASTVADLEYKGRKICGSAQVRHHGAVLQHGTILIRDNSAMLFKLLSYDDEEQRNQHLDDFRKRCVSMEETGFHFTRDELAGAFMEGFSEHFSIKIEEGDLTEGEKTRWRELIKTYSSPLRLEKEIAG